ncbi:MFS transporter [Streptomyces sp. F63]|uniref:MFS transporter n=1 Tax=Streptomyces sp. F63 TaxID=2824887 RepID=UPI001B39781C|nr:MFS transporter [Streptomyces sp. F63]MBQ0986313.1 MFS transporter [Streptomyces sp. F63]
MSALLLVSSPGTVVVIGGLMGAAGALGLAMTGASRQWRSQAGQRSLLGPLRSPELLSLMAVLTVCAVAGGVFNLALPAFAAGRGDPGAVGLLFAAWGVGGALGGIWFGRRKPALPTEQLLSRGVAVFAVLTALPALAWDFWSMAVALLIGGTVIAPVTAVEYDLIGRAAPRGTLAEAFTWVMTANIAGGALGSQLAGLQVHAHETRAAFLTAALVAGAGAVIAFTVRHRLAALPRAADDSPEQHADTAQAAPAN